MERGPDTLQPRFRHASVTDGRRYIYVLGSTAVKAADTVERYDDQSGQWSELPRLITGGKNLSCCHFRSGMNEESLWCLVEGGDTIQRLRLNSATEIWTKVEVSQESATNGVFNLMKLSNRQGMTQISTNEILIFGGEKLKVHKDTANCFLLRLGNSDSREVSLSLGPDLPEPVLPETPGYTLNSNANFYFLGNISEIFRFNKHERSWNKIVFKAVDIFGGAD